MARRPIARLPPLRAMRAFEIVARRLSIRMAAEEMNVTPAAVTQQVKALEDNLGRRLLRRAGRGVELTEDGTRLYDVLHRSFSDISAVISELTWHSPSQLNLSLLPTMAQRWLAPRLLRFRQKYPEVTVRISVSTKLVDFAAEDMDVALRLGRGSWPGLRATLVMDEELFPVCAPALLEGSALPADPEILHRHPLLHTILRPDDWRAWSEHAGVSGLSSSSGYHLENSALALEMAEHGMGFAIARTPLVISALAAGRLVAPFRARLSTDLSYHLVCPDAYARRPEIARFRGWILNEGRLTTEAMENYVMPTAVNVGNSNPAMSVM
jgi:LysR family transcriptional regulator, glycine cleavage system transcriptional activator